MSHRIADGELCRHADYGTGIVVYSLLGHTDGVPVRYYRVLIELGPRGTTMCLAPDTDVAPF